MKKKGIFVPLALLLLARVTTLSADANCPPPHPGPSASHPAQVSLVALQPDRPGSLTLLGMR